MALIKIEMSMPPVDGMDIKFKAPCDCTQITGLQVEYPGGSKAFSFRDCHGNNLAGIGNLFGAGAYVNVIVDANKGYAYLQNGDNNGFLNSAVFGTYTHDGENLTGFGENGKFKATASGTISTINVNGVACSVKCGEESSMDIVAGCWYTFILDGDTVNFNSGGAGGGGLNFKVVGSPQPPASPKENMIWLNTDVPISSYVFSAIQPEPMDEGMVWIYTGTSSPVAFNALKKNGIQVYPISAKQYVSGAWVNKTAKSYHDETWKEWWDGYLYKSGDECVNVSGGWVGSGDGHFGKYGDHLYLLPNANQASYVRTRTAKSVDLSMYNTLKFDIYGSGTFTYIDLQVLDENGSVVSIARLGDMSANASVPRGVYAMDISTLNNPYKIGIEVYGGASPTPVGLYVYNICVE